MRLMSVVLVIAVAFSLLMAASTVPPSIDKRCDDLLSKKEVGVPDFEFIYQYRNELFHKMIAKGMIPKSTNDFLNTGNETLDRVAAVNTVRSGVMQENFDPYGPILLSSPVWPGFNPPNPPNQNK